MCAEQFRLIFYFLIVLSHMSSRGGVTLLKFRKGIRKTHPPLRYLMDGEYMYVYIIHKYKYAYAIYIFLCYYYIIYIKYTCTVFIKTDNRRYNTLEFIFTVGMH